MLGLSKGATGGATAQRGQANSDITIRADVSASANSRFIREALISLRKEHGRLFAIREWRRGDAGEPFLRAATKDLQPCFSTLQADGA
jgi:hypothetical protein